MMELFRSHLPGMTSVLPGGIVTHKRMESGGSVQWSVRPLFGKLIYTPERFLSIILQKKFHTILGTPVRSRSVCWPMISSSFCAQNGYRHRGAICEARRPRGGSLKRLHRPYRFRVWLREHQGERVGLNVIEGFDPDYLNGRPYEASERIYPGGWHGKTGEGQVRAQG